MKRNNIILLFALLLFANLGRTQTLVVSSIYQQPILSEYNAQYGQTLNFSYFVKNIGTPFNYQLTNVSTNVLFLNSSNKDTFYAGFTTIYSPDSDKTSLVNVSIPLDTSYYHLHLDNSSIVIIWPTGAGFQSSVALSSDTTTLYVSYTGIDPDSKVATYLKFYPQPATNTINIFYSNPSISIKSMEIIDISGEKVNNYGFDQKAINISQISAGVYFLQVIFSDGETGTYKIIKGAN